MADRFGLVPQQGTCAGADVDAEEVPCFQVLCVDFLVLESR
jgi:hypothetical protein